MTFLVKCKIDEYLSSQGEEMRYRYTLTKALPTNLKEQNAYLIDQLLRYQQIP